MISSGDNFPTVNLRRDNLSDLVLLLHHRVSLDSVRSHFGWTEEDLHGRIEHLIGAGIVREDGMLGYVPTIMVMCTEHVERHMSVSPNLVDETVKIIESRLLAVQSIYESASGLAQIPFEDSAFLVLSDVILDNWQINAVEDQFLGADRPPRDGKRYYFSLQENDPAEPTEAFGIYGNQYRGVGPFTIGIYGNRRSNNPLNFASLDAVGLGHFFGVEPDTASVFKQELISQIVEAVDRVPDSIRIGFEALGWVEDGELRVPVLRADDLKALDEIADLFTEDLVGLLNRHRPVLEEMLDSSPYQDEVTFEEYAIWWYHLYYTAVTDRMAERNLLRIPGSGITSYVIVNES